MYQTLYYYIYLYTTKNGAVETLEQYIIGLDASTYTKRFTNEQNTDVKNWREKKQVAYIENTCKLRRINMCVPDVSIYIDTWPAPDVQQPCPRYIISVVKY